MFSFVWLYNLVTKLLVLVHCVSTDEKYLVLFPENSLITDEVRGAGSPQELPLRRGGDYAAGTASVVPNLSPGFGDAFLGGE